MTSTRGYTGSRGVQGTIGSRGLRGYSGSKGVTGSFGYTGSRGVKGARGYTGSRGAGFTGSRGGEGNQGERGHTGSRGLLGYTGSRGLRGFVGYHGSKGFTGSSAAGYVGSKGIQGYTGSRGTDGTDGERGLRGYTGSIGDQGARGYTGPRGWVGSRGLQGVDGYIGSRGPQGNNGFSGSRGVVGSRGFSGSRGIPGFIGSAGTDGYTGSQGIRGITGYVGSAGTAGGRGYTGSKGVIGYTGSRGATGATGSRGATGPLSVIGTMIPSNVEPRRFVEGDLYLIAATPTAWTLNFDNEASLQYIENDVDNPLPVYALTLEDETGSGGKAFMRLQATDQTSYEHSVIRIKGNMGDGYYRMLFRVSGNTVPGGSTQHGPALHVRQNIDESGDAGTSYSFGHFRQTGTGAGSAPNRIRLLIDGVSSVLDWDDAALPFAHNQWAWAELYVNGTTLEGRYWLENDTRPTDPVVAATDGTLDINDGGAAISMLGRNTVFGDIASFVFIPVGGL